MTRSRGDGYREPEGGGMTILFKLQNVFAAGGLHLLYTLAVLLVVYTVLWFLGVYDQDAPEELLLALPNLYRQGRLGLVYKPHSFWITMADSLYQSIVIFFLTEGVSFLLLLHHFFCIYSVMYHIILVCVCACARTLLFRHLPFWFLLCSSGFSGTSLICDCVNSLSEEKHC